jgi:hypothetical protein
MLMNLNMLLQGKCTRNAQINAEALWAMLLMTFDNLSVGPKKNSGDCLRNRRSYVGYGDFLAMVKK